MSKNNHHAPVIFSFSFFWVFLVWWMFGVWRWNLIKNQMGFEVQRLESMDETKWVVGRRLRKGGFNVWIRHGWHRERERESKLFCRLFLSPVPPLLSFSLSLSLSPLSLSNYLILSLWLFPSNGSINGNNKTEPPLWPLFSQPFPLRPKHTKPTFNFF